MLTQSDVRRRTFCLDFLGADWVSPLEYHLTVNVGSLGLASLDVVADAAARHWARARTQSGNAGGDADPQAENNASR